MRRRKGGRVSERGRECEINEKSAGRRGGGRKERGLRKVGIESDEARGREERRSGEGVKDECDMSEERVWGGRGSGREGRWQATRERRDERKG